jgi:phosphoserine phosphatase RsbU/P
MNEVTRVLVLRGADGAPAEPADELCAALVLGGFATGAARLGAVHELVRRAPVPDVLLAPSSLGAEGVQRLCRAVEGTEAGVMVYLDGDLDALEECVREGVHYLVPPFRGTLLRAQLACTTERRRLAEVVHRHELITRLRAVERELEIAREIQLGFLPPDLPQMPGWELAARFRPARAVAGDFYDAYPRAESRRMILTIADVCDKGVGAALYTALIRTLLRHGIQQGAGEEAAGTGLIARAVSGANRYLTANHGTQGYFATVFCGALDERTGRLDYVNGGHNPPLLHRAGGWIERLPTTGPAVGIFAGGQFGTGHVTLRRGDTLLLFTDGVTDARDESGAFFGEERLLDALLGYRGGPAPLLDRIEERLERHVGETDQYDDITMLAVHHTAAGV